MIASVSTPDGAGRTATASDPAAFRILHVCVGNVCRSVLAERLMRHAVGAHGNAATGGGVRNSSAGTHAVPGLAMHPYIARILRTQGAPTDDFTTRKLTREHIADANLVLTATRVERDRVVAILPQALQRTFTLTEFARLAPHAAAARGPDPLDAAMRSRVIAAALALRGRAGYVDPATDDIPDPPATPEGFALCAERIGPALRAVVDALFPPPVPGG